MIIDPLNREQRDEFIDRAKSGDPMRDWYSEIDLIISLEHAYAAIDGMENAAKLVGAMR